MHRRHPHSASTISISEDVKTKLFRASLDTGFEKEDWEIAAEAVDDWIRRHHPDGIALLPTKGYQWKSMFLPDGTLLRTVFGGKNHHCFVENDRIVYNGHAVSPSGFVNAVGGMRRNAWRSTWILLPDTHQWELADALRNRRRRPPQVRKPVHSTEQAPVALPPTQPSAEPHTVPPAQPLTEPSDQPLTEPSAQRLIEPSIPPSTGCTSAVAPPAAEPAPAQAQSVAASSAWEQSMRPGSHGKALQTGPDHASLSGQPRPDAIQAPHGCRRRAERRSSRQGPRMHELTSSG